MKPRRWRERRKGASRHYRGPTRRREDREGARPPHPSSLGDWLHAHRLALANGLKRLRANLFATWLTILVVGIALALPTAVDLGIDHLTRLTDRWQRIHDLSLFLQPQQDDQTAQRLAERLRQDPDILGIRLITRAQALDELRRQADLEEALTLLGDNPLPPVLVITPRPRSPAALAALKDRLASLPEVDSVRQDSHWVARLQALLDLGQRLATLLGLLSVVAVTVIVGNTLRLVAQAHTDELRVSRLLGATDAYLRRPFLYTGLFYGLAGALTAWLLVLAGGLWLAPAVSRLAELYQSSFQLPLPDRRALLLLGLGGPLLGWFTAWVVIQYQIRRLDLG